MNRSIRPPSGSRVEARAKAAESPDAMKARHAAADAAAAARTAAEVARLTAAGLAGHHDGLAAIKREASAQLRSACRTADLAKGNAAMATLSAVHALEPHGA